MGVYEADGDYAEFKTLGAKSMHITMNRAGKHMSQ